MTKFFLEDVLPHSKEDEDFYLTFIMDAFLNSLVRWLSGGYRKRMDAYEYTSKIKDVILKMALAVEKDA